MAGPEARKPLYVIGLTGVPSVGKGEVVKILRRWGQKRGWRVGYLSFSDQIKEEARARGIAEARFTRELLSGIVTEMREAEGPAVLAKRILAKVGAVPGPDCPELFVVEAIRHVSEIELLRRELGGRFLVLAIVADPEVVAERLVARRRADESSEALRSKERALEMILAELRGEAPACGVHVGACIEQADAQIENNATLEYLKSKVMAAVERLLPGTPA